MTRRHRQSGFSMITALLLLFLLAFITATLQTRGHSNLRVLSRLTVSLQDRAARDALTELLRGPLAGAMTNIDGTDVRLDGTPFEMEWAGRTWRVRAQDLAGLIDVYLASEAVLAALPLDATSLASRRAKVLSTLPPGGRFPTLQLSLVNFGVDPAVYDTLATQSGYDVPRIRTLPAELRSTASALPPGSHENAQVTRVVLSIEKMSD